MSSSPRRLVAGKTHQQLEEGTSASIDAKQALLHPIIVPEPSLTCIRASGQPAFKSAEHVTLSQAVFPGMMLIGAVNPGTALISQAHQGKSHQLRNEH